MPLAFFYPIVFGNVAGGGKDTLHLARLIFIYRGIVENVGCAA